MIPSSTSSQGFPRQARLLKSRDFVFDHCRRAQTDHFRFFFSHDGKGRMGVSLSKKVIPLSVGRNRIRRLLRESFRLHRHQLGQVDVHIVGKPELRQVWKALGHSAIDKEFIKWLQVVGNQRR